MIGLSKEIGTISLDGIPKRISQKNYLQMRNEDWLIICENKQMGTRHSLTHSNHTNMVLYTAIYREREDKWHSVYLTFTNVLKYCPVGRAVIRRLQRELPWTRRKIILLRPKVKNEVGYLRGRRFPFYKNFKQKKLDQWLPKHMS